MPWKDTTIMEQKIEFICEWRTGNYTITELCRSFEISRPTAYKIIARFENEGYEGLRELSRKPRGTIRMPPMKMVVNRILEA
jgi:transposase